MNPSPVESECDELPMVKTPPPNPISNTVRMTKYPTASVIIPSSEAISPEAPHVASTRQTSKLSLDQSNPVVLLRGNRSPASSSEPQGRWAIIAHTTHGESTEGGKYPPEVKPHSRSRSSPAIAVLQGRRGLRARGAPRRIDDVDGVEILEAKLQ